MKNIITIIGISSLTTIIVVAVLWNMGFLSPSPSITPQLEKGKEVLNIDPLSQLLKLDYPQIGDDIERAYTMFEDIRFESENQSDFYILDKSQAIYIKYNNGTNMINALTIHGLKGDTEKIRSLGELMLPDDFIHLTENYNSIEDRNEIFRYTKTEHVYEYYYESPISNQYALIQIDYDISDILGEPTEQDTSNPRYSLEVSLMNDSKFDSMNDYGYNEAVTYEDIENAMNTGDLVKFNEYIKVYNYTINELSELLLLCSYYSSDRNSYGYNAFAQILLDHGANPNYPDEQGYTALSHAALFANISLIEMLLEAGADKDFVLSDGRTIREEVYSQSSPEVKALFK